MSTNGKLIDLETPAWPDTYGDEAKDRVGFFTDTSVCIGCKACEVACKEWNQVPSDSHGFTGMSYDHSVELGLVDENSARLGSFVAADDAAALEHVDQAPGARVTDA